MDKHGLCAERGDRDETYDFAFAGNCAGVFVMRFFADRLCAELSVHRNG